MNPPEVATLAFDLLTLLDSIILPSAVLTHTDLNSRKLLRLCCKRLRADVDAHVTSITINRYNIAKLQPTVPGSFAHRYPRLRRLAFGANEPRDVAALLWAQLPALSAASLDCLDFWSYYASISIDLWNALVELAPPALLLRLNINESLLRRMEVAAVLAALERLRNGRPGLVVEFNTGHTSFGFRSTEAETLRFLSSANYVRSLGFSIGLHGRELQDSDFFKRIATVTGPATSTSTEAVVAAAVAAPPWPRCLQPSVAATAIEAFSLTHYEASERPPVGPLLYGIHMLAALRSLTLDCEISLLELAPLAACSTLTQLTIDLLTARPQALPHQQQMPPPSVLNPGLAADANGAGGDGAARGFRAWPAGAVTTAVAVALPQVASLTLGSESHPAQQLSGVFSGLKELVCVPCTRTVGVYNVFHCGLMLGGASFLTRLALSCVVEAAVPSRLAHATALTALAFTHADNASTAGLLCAAAKLPRLRRLALWDHEDADEYLALRQLLISPLPPQEGAQEEEGARPEVFGSSRAPAAVAPLALVFRHLEELEIRATAPEFFDEVTALLAAGTLRFGAAHEDEPMDGCVGGGCSRLRRARLDACFDPPLLQVAQLGELLAALGPDLRQAVVSGWGIPGREAAVLRLGREIGRLGLVMEYEYPIL